MEIDFLKKKSNGIFRKGGRIDKEEKIQSFCF